MDNLSVPLLRIAFLRASARACAVDIVVAWVVEGNERMANVGTVSNARGHHRDVVSAPGWCRGF